MDIITIREEHMKIRCYFIFVMCMLSLYSLYNYSLFDPITNDFYTVYYQNCILFIFYLCWDIYQMTMSRNRIILFRKDLIIHHIVSLVSYLVCINKTTLQMSNVLIMECISLMNYIWKDNIKVLTFYRTACIVCIRIPTSLYFLLYYNPTIMEPYLKSTVSPFRYQLLVKTSNIYLFLIVYDIYILRQIYRPTHKRINN
jgi:ABC-type proline/glycine betaine transport system permease subunit